MTTDPSAGPAAPITNAAEALAELVAGNKRFVSSRPEHGHRVSAAAAASGRQQPHAVVLGCIDSRVPLEAIFDQTFGSICVVRSGAHVVDRAVLGSVGFAVAELGVPLIMVLGHKRCGAVAASVSALRAGEIPAGEIGYLVDEIAPAVRAVGVDEPEAAEKAMRAHVGRTVRRVGAYDVVADAVAAGRVDVVGAVYDLDTGVVELLP
ncbi:carbonic anhydrase [Paractinoplanes abujensis]|uniref:Carbonic anhydrase n=1 Tax=Paractinoplanes abujensis TaxID=882441 RepID=A0A7W7G3D9_9ACTN|nr:carbonic anhydrase [Actinoplanes abujensis]MBB4694569.1 carbonic anhydrase [Actinoplanes abujensis]GID20217.1 carbonic anhydrase [Actinoplanes abujensis]